MAYYPPAPGTFAAQFAGMTLQSRAGETPLLARFAQGNVVILQCSAGGKQLSIHDFGMVEGIDKRARHAQFTVHVRRPGVVALQNVYNPQHWLAIRDGQTIGTGRGGPYCEFYVREIEGTSVALESTMSPGQHVGLLPDGRVKEPHKTGRGPHGRFTPSVRITAPGASLAPPVGSVLLPMFMEGNVVLLRSQSGGNYLRVFQGRVEGKGGSGRYAQLRVHVRRPGVVALECVGSPGQYVAIQDGKTVIGGGGKFCDLIVKEVGQCVCLESVQFPGQHIGVFPDSSMKPANKAGTGANGQFVPTVHSYGNSPGPAPAPAPVPVPVPTPQAGGRLLSMFTEGNVVLLRSQSGGNYLRVFQGRVEGRGGRGKYAQLRVHVRRPGVVALECVGSPGQYVAIRDDGQTVIGGGGKFCDLVVKEVGQCVCLESTQFPGQHIGVLPNSTMKPARQTGTGLHGQFVPTVHSRPPVVFQQQPPQPAFVPPPQPVFPPPPQPMFPPPPGSHDYPPPYPGFPPQGGAGGYPLPSAPPPGPSASGVAQLPFGYSVMDAFKNGNVVQLIARSNGYPLQIKNAMLYGNGSFTQQDSQFTVVNVEGYPGLVMLQNIGSVGHYIAIRNGYICGDGKGGRYCYFRLGALPDNYITLESVEHPGQFICMNSNGSVGSPLATGPRQPEAQFFIRVEKQKHPYSAPIMTPFGRASIANQLRDGMVLQLYLKSTYTYLGISSGGDVINTANPNDKHTFFVLRDRGMGIYSLQSYLYDGLILRTIGYVMQGRGDPNLNADYRLKETADGRVCFESVTCPGSFVTIMGGESALNLFNVNIQKFVGNETITKTPLN